MSTRYAVVDPTGRIIETSTSRIEALGRADFLTAKTRKLHTVEARS